jgi:hypothetical protein
MDVKLKNIQILDPVSNQSTAFMAVLYINNQRAGVVGNKGNGTNTFCEPYPDSDPRLIKIAEYWCQSCLTGMDLAGYVYKLALDHREQRFLLRP